MSIEVSKTLALIKYSAADSHIFNYVEKALREKVSIL